jgi:elongation factor P
MLSYNELKPGVFIVLNGQPFIVLESQFLRMQMRKPVMKAKLKNLFSGSIVERSFQQTDELEQADLERMKAKFLYSNRGEFWFCEADNQKNRFMIKEEIVGDLKKFLKPNLEAEAFKFNGKIISIELPIKSDYKVVEAPPAIRGDTAQGGTKVVTIETGAKVNVPLFINEGDIIKVNTQTGDYVERVEKL